MTTTAQKEIILKVLQELRAVMPPLVPRTHVSFKIWTGVGGRRMANLDVAAEGPKERVVIGRQIYYPREALLEWIGARLRLVSCRLDQQSASE